MYLIKTALAGTRFTTEFVKNQPNAAPAELAEDHSFVGDAKILTKFPIGTIFAIDDAVWGSVVSTVKGEIRPVFIANAATCSVFAKSMVSTDNKATQQDIEIAYETILADQDMRKHADSFVKQVTDMGYTLDVEAKKKEAGIVGDGLTLRDRIVNEYPCPSYEETGFYVDPEVWYLIIRNVIQGESTLLIGPTGSGKTELVSLVAKAMRKTLNYQDMGTVQDAQSALLGVHRLNKEGHSSFEYAPFASYVQSEGIVLLDELNRAPLSAANILFPCLDKRRYLPIDIACSDSDRKIGVHKDCVFFATANLGAEYSGTTQIDRALLDRFFPIELTYPEQDHETQILMIRTGVTEKNAKAIVRVSSTIREQYKQQELSNVVSVRHTLTAASLIRDGFDVVGALMKVVMPLFEDSDGISERTKVKSIIAAN